MAMAVNVSEAMDLKVTLAMDVKVTVAMDVKVTEAGITEAKDVKADIHMVVAGTTLAAVIIMAIMDITVMVIVAPIAVLVAAIEFYFLRYNTNFKTSWLYYS